MAWRSIRFGRYVLAALLLEVLCLSLMAAQTRGPALPRLPDGKPDFRESGSRTAKPAADVQPFVEGREIPYKPAAETKKRENFTNRAKADPLVSCFMPGVPRIMYLEYPYQIFQAKDHIAITYEWSSVFRLIYTTTKVVATSRESTPGWEIRAGAGKGTRWSWMSSGSNDRTWFDLAGNYHSDKMRVTERYTLTDADTIRYEATVTDPEIFTRPWKISFPIHRVKNKARVLEFQCQAEKEEKNGDFERDPRTWYPKR